MFTCEIMGNHQTPLPRPKRVAIYCRVSTTQCAQSQSLEAQAKRLMDYVVTHPAWNVVGVYCDQASGRNNLKMTAFQQMLKECRAGRIDLILIKSISRLGRNTLQVLETCRELKKINVDVYFDIEHLYFSNPNAELTLTIYASISQTESEDKSSAIRWGNHVRFQNGTSGLYDRTCYGYRHDANGKLEIEPEKAEVVRKIFRWRYENKSLRTIAGNLMQAGIPAPRGGEVWHIETIRKILGNEKYYGDVFLQKTFVEDYFTGKQRRNSGECNKYLARGHHEAIMFT